MTEAERQAAELEKWVAAGAAGTYGTEWGDPRRGALLHVRNHLRDWLGRLPACAQVLEIGPGGGRWTDQIVESLRASHMLWLFDGTDAAFPELTRRYDVSSGPFLFGARVSRDGSMPQVGTGTLDLAFSFDTFVHFHTALFLRYVAELARTIKPGGRLMIHYATPKSRETTADLFNGSTFFPPVTGVLAALDEAFELDSLGMNYPMPAGLGSVFRSLRRRG